MQKVITTLQDILTPLCENQKNIWDKEDWIPIFTEWPPLAREDIETLFKQAKTKSLPVPVDFLQSQRGQVLYLPPLERDPRCVPILSLYCKLQEPQSIMKLRVMLVSLDENRGPDGIYGIGFRMETPESINQNMSLPANNQSAAFDNGGAHDFHHAQLIRKFGQRKLDNKLQIDCPIWLPQSQPSFPLPAKCPVTLLLCLIVTLYGRRYYNQFLTEHEISDISGYQQELNQWINQ